MPFEQNVVLGAIHQPAHQVRRRYPPLLRQAVDAIPRLTPDSYRRGLTHACHALVDETVSGASLGARWGLRTASTCSRIQSASVPSLWIAQPIIAPW